MTGSWIAVDSDEGRLILDGVRRLNGEVLEPAERLLDRLPRSGSIYDHEAYLAGLARAREMDLHRLSVPADVGGLGGGPAIGLRTIEAIAAGAPGFASTLWREVAAAAMTTSVAAESPEADGVHAALRDASETDGGLTWGVLRGAGASSVDMPDQGLELSIDAAQGAAEPSHDAGTTRVSQVPDAHRARWLLLFVPPAEPADDAAEVHLLDLEDGDGVRVLPPLVRSGLRVQAYADVDVDGRLLRESAPVFEGSAAVAWLGSMLSASALGMAACAVGAASHAHGYALEYADSRVQGGRPIVEHESIADMLWRTRTAVEAVRRSLRSTALESEGRTVPLLAALEVRSAAATMVGRATTEMTELLGGYGVTTDYPVEKLYRDAGALTVASGTVHGRGIRVRIEC